MGPKITVARSSNSQQLQERLKTIGKRAAYVGIPASSSRDRASQLLKMAAKITKPGKRKTKLLDAAAEDVNNAELLYIFSKGSPAKGQPGRPVIEPSIEADGNRQPIAREIAGSMKASLNGDQNGATQGLKRAAMAGQNAARGWFTDGRNHWKENAKSTIRAKGSDQPGIDTGAMRNAIVGVVADDDASSSQVADMAGEAVGEIGADIAEAGEGLEALL